MQLRTIFTLIASFGLLLSFAQNGEPVMEMGIKKLNLHALEEDKSSKSKYSFAFVYDSMPTVKLPKNMWGIDTTVQLDLETQEEHMVFAVDSTVRVHNNLGLLTKQEVSAAVGDGLNLTKHCECVMVAIDLVIIKESGTVVHIDYAQPEQVQKAKQAIEALPKNAQVVVKRMRFKCTDNQGGFDEMAYDNMAVVRIKE